ncbi:hypothetical protein Tco_1224440 [Tanacetum coccineum]
MVKHKKISLLPKIKRTEAYTFLLFEKRGLKCCLQTPYVIEERGLNRYVILSLKSEAITDVNRRLKDVHALKLRVPALTLRVRSHSYGLVMSSFEPFGGSLSTLLVQESNNFPVGIHLRPTLVKILPVGFHLRQDLGDVFSYTVEVFLEAHCFRKDEERAGTSGVGNGDGNEDGADNNEVDVEEENEPTEMGIDAEISLK